MQAARVLVVQLPGGQPGGDVGFELRGQGLEGTCEGGGSYDFQDGQEDVVARFAGKGEDVEDGGEGLDGERGAVGG